MARLNFENLTPSNGAVKDLSQLIYLELLKAEDLSSLFTIVPNQKNGDKVALITGFGLIGRAGTGCDPEYDDSVIGTGEQTWNMAAWEIAEQICYEALEGTLAQVALRSKTDIGDLTGTEYLDDVVYPLLVEAARKMLMRFAWFGDTAAASVENGGVIADAANVPYFNVTDGFWKKVYAAVAANAARQTAIAANAEATFAAQKAAIRGAGVATGIMDNLIMDAPMALRQAEDQVIYISQALKDALDYDIRNNNKGSELQWQAIFGGVQEARYNGITVRVVPFWDEIIQGFEGVEGGASYNKPYRALYTVKRNLLVGVGGDDSFIDLQVWFERKERQNYIYAADKIGTIIVDANLLQAAF